MEDKDLVGRIGNLDNRARNLATGAHPSMFRFGGFGVNGQWKVISINSPFTRHDLTQRPSLRLRADHVLWKGRFRYTGMGWPTGKFATLPREFWPSNQIMGYATDTAGGPIRMRVTALGEAFIEKPSTGNIVILDTVRFPSA